MRLLLIVSLLSSSLAACSDDAEPTQEEEEGVSDPAAVAAALTRELDFEGGEIVSGDVPESDDETVLLLPLVDTVLMSPGQASVMPFNLFNADNEDPVVATLLQFHPHSDHVTVPVPGKSGSAGDVDNPSQLSEKACVGLCARTYAIRVSEALQLESGKIGKHASRTVILDCREDPRAIACAGDDTESPDASFNEALDASVPVAARVRGGFLDAVKAICECEVAMRPVALLCAGTLAESMVECHTEALIDYAASSSADLQCAIDGADSSPACLMACSDTALEDCLGELTACGVDMAQVERALLSCETFMCADGTSRVDGSKLCDGTDDCGDGTDEGSPTCDSVQMPQQ